jgi:hypothetical protein
MDIMSNFERARKLTAEWPSWKRDYQLTKNPDANAPQAEPTVEKVNAEIQNSAGKDSCGAFAEH